jgi:small-conductance mechanosensitive channel
MTKSPRRYISQINFGIERALREAAIELPFPQRDLHVRSGSFTAPLPPASPPVS